MGTHVSFPDVEKLSVPETLLSRSSWHCPGLSINGDPLLYKLGSIWNIPLRFLGYVWELGLLKFTATNESFSQCPHYFI